MTTNTNLSVAIKTADFYSFLNDAANELDTAPIDIDRFDASFLRSLANGLKERYAESDAGATITFGNVLADINTAFNDHMQTVVSAHYAALAQWGTPEDPESYTSLTLVMADQFERVQKSAAFFAESLFTNWGAVEADGIFSAASQQGWSQDPADSGGQSDVFQREMVYSLQVLDNVKQLGEAISDPNTAFSEFDDRPSEIAAFALKAAKTVAAATKVDIKAYEKTLAEHSFQTIDAITFDDDDLARWVNNYRNSVVTNTTLNSLVQSTTGGQTTNTKLDYDAYASKLREFQAEISARHDSRQTDIDRIDSELTHNSERIEQIDQAVDSHEKLLQLQEPDARAQIQDAIDILETERLELSLENHNLTEDRAKITADNDALDRLQTTVDTTVKSYHLTDQTANLASNGAKLLSIGANISSMVANGVQTNDATKYAAGGLGIAADLTDFVATATKMINATKGATNFQTGAGAVGSVLGVGPQVASFALAIQNLEKASPEDRGYYIGEAVVQGANVAMGLAMASLTTYAAVTGAAVSKAVPVLGVIASVASAINPLQWKAFAQQADQIETVEAKTDPQSEAYETSASFLAELLTDFHEIEIGFYTASTATGVAGGVAASVAGATGVGAPISLLIGGITAGVTVILENTKQVALNDAADRIADKIRGFEGGVEGFFDQSFDYQTDQELDDFLSDAQALIDGGFDSVSAIGSVQMTGSDIYLAALTGIGGELATTEKHFAGFLDSGELGKGTWNKVEIAVDPKGGDIKRGNEHDAATGRSNLLKFLTPLDAAGTEQYERQEVSKNNYKTTLKIDDLSGWTLTDGGDDTTFDLRNIVTVARESKDADLESVQARIRAGAGDDSFVMTEMTGRTDRNGSGVYLGNPNIDGGTGTDVATYGGLSHLEKGIHVGLNAAGNLVVEKTVSADAYVLQGAIGEFTASRGKESETIQYRYITSDHLGEVATLYDELRNVEVVVGTDLDDTFDLTTYGRAFLNEDYFSEHVVHNLTADLRGTVTASASSIYGSNYGAAEAIDGIYYDDGNMFHSGNGDVNWLEIDLKDAFLLTKIVLHNRAGSNGERLNGAEVEFYDADHRLVHTSRPIHDAKTGDSHVVFPEIPDTVQYVRVVQRDQFLQLADVQVYGVEPENVPGVDRNFFNGVPRDLTAELRGTATVQASSVHDNRFLPSEAIDGITGAGNFWHSDKEAYNHITVDLKDVYAISDVEVYNRPYSYGERLNGLNVAFFDENMRPVYLALNDQVRNAETGDIHTIHLDKDVGARYVRLYQFDQYMQIGEIKVFGTEIGTGPKPYVFYGLGGHDSFLVGQGQAVSGGDGNDTFTAVGQVLTRGETDSDLPFVVDVNGDAGFDTFNLNGEWAHTTFRLGAQYVIAEQILEGNPELADSLMPQALASERGEDMAVATVANMVSEDGWAMSSIVSLNGVENVNWDLNEITKVLYGDDHAEMPNILRVSEFNDAAQTLLDRSTVGDYNGLITYDASKMDATGSEGEGYVIMGTSGNEGIKGSDYADVLSAGDGDDWLDGGKGHNILIGGGGTDTFLFNFRDRAENEVKLTDFNLSTEESADYGDQTKSDRFVFDLRDLSLGSVNFARTGTDKQNLTVSDKYNTTVIESFFTEAYSEFNPLQSIATVSFLTDRGETGVSYMGLTERVGADVDHVSMTDFMASLTSNHWHEAGWAAEQWMV